MKRLYAPVLVMACTAAQAHPGHGLDGSHWHATDSWGFIATIVTVGIAVAWWRGRK